MTKKGISPGTSVDPVEEASPKTQKNEIKIANIGSERVCIGSTLIDNKLFYEYGDDFSEEIFTNPVWRGIFKLQRHLHNEGYEVDKNTIINCAGRMSEVADMLSSVGGIEILDNAIAFDDTKNFAKHVSTIRNLYDKRMIVEDKRRELSEIERMAHDESVTPSQIIETIDTHAVDISAKIHKVDDYNIVIIDPADFLKRAEAKKAAGRTFEGVKTNMPAFDDMIGGLANGRLYVLGAPTGCGKSLLNISLAAASAYGFKPGDQQSKHLIIDTGELIYRDDFLPRLLSNMSGVFSRKIMNHSWVDNDFDKKRIQDAARRMNENPIIWKQMTDFDGPQVRSLIRRMKHKFGIECVWFDNIKINPRWKQSEAYGKIGDLAQYLKDTAVELEIPIFAMIQLTNDATVVGKKKSGFTHAHVDMFAGGRRTLQNTDIGIAMDWLNPEDPYDDNRIMMVQKNRFGEFHRKGEYFEATGDLRQSKLFIAKNHIRDSAALAASPAAPTLSAPQPQGQAVAFPPSQATQKQSGILPGSKLINPGVDFSQIPDFD